MNGVLVISGRLTATAALTALVSTRIYPDVMPDSPTFPSVTYHRLSGKSEKGAISDPPLKSAVFQVSAWAKTRLASRQIAAQVRIALDRLRKVMVAGVAVDDCFYEDDVDGFDAVTKTYFTHTTFQLYYRDPA